MRLIDADELLEHAGRDRLDSRELIFKMIEDAPTVKAAPDMMDISRADSWIQNRLKLMLESMFLNCVDKLSDESVRKIAYEVGLTAGAIHQCLYKELADKYMKKGK